MAAFQTLAVLGCVGAIGVGAAGLGIARLVPDNDLAIARVNGAAEEIPKRETPTRQIQSPQLSQIEHARDASEQRGSLYYWRASNERRSGRSEQGAFVIPARETLPVSAERLAYERELFSREVKDNMLVAKAASPAKLADHQTVKSGAKIDSMAQANAADTSSVAPQKPKKKRVVRARRDAPVMAFGAPFETPFAMR